MKVLLIDINCKHSSTGKIVYDLYSGLKSSGHIAAICYGRGPLVEEPNIYKFGIDIETYIHAFLTRVTGLTGVDSPFSTNRLIRFIDEFRPDVVHIHELHAYFVNIAPVMNYLKKNNIKTVWTFHCEFMYTGKCGYAYDCNKWKYECSECPQVAEYPKSLYFDFTKQMFNHKKQLFGGFDNLTIVTPSKWLADRLKQSFLKDKDIRVIHNGIDTETNFYPRPYDDLKIKHNLTDEKIILAVAPDLMSDCKGGQWVLQLAKRFQGKNVKFILIGVEDVSISHDENVVLLGRTSNQIELAKYYSMADVFVICSKRENFPTTCIEALACGTPVVGFDEGGTKETAPDKLGKFVEYGDIEALQEAVKKNIDGANLAFEFENYAQNNYSKIRMLDNYKKLYFN